MDAKLWGEEFNRHNPPKKVPTTRPFVLICVTLGWKACIRTVYGILYTVNKIYCLTLYLQDDCPKDPTVQVDTIHIHDDNAWAS